MAWQILNNRVVWLETGAIVKRKMRQAKACLPHKFYFYVPSASS
jgi:hypothetical protein